MRKVSIAAGGGRPSFCFTEKELSKLEELAMLGLSYADLASAMFVNQYTLKANYSEFIQAARITAKAELLKQQWKLVLKGNPTILVWMGKQILGQSDRPENQDHQNAEQEAKDINMQEVRKFLAEREKRGQEPARIEVQQNARLKNGGKPPALLDAEMVDSEPVEAVVADA